MGKLISNNSGNKPIVEVIKNIDIKKFDIPINTDILINNGWECAVNDDDYDNWYPVLPQVYDEARGKWVEQDEDFEEFTIWFWESKDVWCYKYGFGTYVYDVKSIGDLEIILAMEGFIYEFDV